ncbi:MAG: hypothetical protein VW258_06395, partial [Thalassolituus sp.]
MHPRLEQQLTEHLKESTDDHPELREKLSQLLDAVSATYSQFEQQETTLKHSLEQSARSMLERNAVLTRNL